ncbi:MAG: nucleotidyltransferase family protein [Peptococcaceae bacterium]
MIKLSERELDIVRTILNKHVPTFEVFVFGSRYQGNVHESSDLDIAIKGPAKLDLLLLANIRDEFQSSELSFRVDLLDFNRISPEFQDIILNNSICLNNREI